MHRGNGATVTFNVHTTIATTVTAILEAAVGIFFGGRFMLVVNSYLLKLGHCYTSY
jgi:hypothetical protein